MNQPILIDQPNLARAWAEAFLTLRRAPRHRLSPVTISFRGFERVPIEEQQIRLLLDRSLEDAGMQSVQTVANTIFPQVLWQLAKGNRHNLYARYKADLPDYVAMEPGKNRRGLYFGRLIAFDMDHRTGDRLPYVPEGSIPEDGNQLEFIIKQCRKGVRASEFQASIFDPARDHTKAAQLGFPCLQHVTLVPTFSDGTMMLNAFYATQQLFEKGYGNFLGLARLGLFVADQTGLTLSRVTCFAGIEKMERRPRAGGRFQTLIEACEALVSDQQVLGAAC